MFLKRYLLKTSNLFAENRILKFCVVFLAAGFVWNSYQLSDAKEKIRTVVVPPVINSQIEITGSWTTDAYAKEYIRYIGSLLWNYNPGVARKQFGEFISSWHPSVFEDAKKRLYIMADQIELTKASSVFYINRVEHSPDKKLIEVMGNRRLTQQDKEVENTSKTYLVSYRVENGRFWVTGVEDKAEAGKTQNQIGNAAAPTQIGNSQGVSNATK